MCSQLGFRFNAACARLTDGILQMEDSYPSGLVSDRDVNAFCDDINAPANQGVCSYLDKNPGLGCIVCPNLFWHTLRDAFWLNPDYEHTSFDAASLLDFHQEAHARGQWAAVAPFEGLSPPANVPFLYGKFKSNLKNRPVLAAFRHCLRRVYQRAALAVRVCLLCIVGDGAWDANVFTTFDAPALILRHVDRAVDSAVQTSRTGCERDLGVDAYAGDVSSMFDKLPCRIVIEAVGWALDKASHLSARYNLRTASRQHVTINLRDPSGHRIGRSYDGEGVITLTFPIIVAICEHYCFNTFFSFAGVFFRLRLGVPQGGSLSDPLSKVFCMYCEHQWLSSLFDSSRFSESGVIRACDMTPHGLARFSVLAGVTLDPRDDTPLAYAVLKRYADDCRAICIFDRTTQPGAAVARAFIDAYRADCYADPCTLDDEERGTAFQFMQGAYTFSPRCNSVYIVKNALPLLTTGRTKLRAMQHYTSYGHAPSQLRFATVMGKLAEVDAVCSDAQWIVQAVCLLCVELSSLHYPPALVTKALYRKYQQTDRQLWRDLIPAAVSLSAWAQRFFMLG
jgi:hypothetical protein